MTRRPIVPILDQTDPNFNWIDAPFLDSTFTMSSRRGEAKEVKLSYDCRIFTRAMARTTRTSPGTETWIAHGIIIESVHRHPSLGPRHREPPPSLWPWRFV